jgi:hypothetical protein
MKSIRVCGFYGLSGLGLSYLVAKKELLVQIKLYSCHGISSEGYHCLTTLTNLTSLTISSRYFDDIGLNMICSSCLLIEYLEIRNKIITVEGLTNIHCLTHLKTLYLFNASDNWLSKISNNSSLTFLELSEGTISFEGLSHLLSSLVKLTSVKVSGTERLALA